MPVAGSRVDEVKALLELMKAQGLTNLKVGDIELTMAPPVPAPGDDEPKGRVYSTEELAAKGRAERRRIMLAASGGIIGRASSD